MQKNEGNILKITQSFWSLLSNEIQTNFISANTRDTSMSDNKYIHAIKKYYFVEICRKVVPRNA